MESIPSEETINFDASVRQEFLNILEKAEGQLDTIDDFAEDIGKKLSQFELENMDIFERIDFRQQEVDEIIDQALENIEQYEFVLNQYEKSLVNIRSNFDELETFSAWEQNQKNQIRLFSEISKILEVIDIDASDIENMLDVKSPVLPVELNEFSAQLISLNQRKFLPGISQLLAVKTQLAAGEVIAKQFCESFVQFIDKLTKYLFEKFESSEPSSHEEIHKMLNLYSPIVARVKTLDPLKYSDICNIYNKNFNTLYLDEWSKYFEKLSTKVPSFDANKCKKENHSIFYREEQEFKTRCRIVTELINNLLSLTLKVTSDLGYYGNIFFAFTTIVEPVADSRQEGETPIKKRRGGELKLREMQRVIFSFLSGYIHPFFTELDNSDPFYIVPMYDILEHFSYEGKENDYFCFLLSDIRKDFDERIKALTATAITQADFKKSKKSNISDLLKIYKDFLMTCSFIFPKNTPETFLPLIMLRNLFNHVFDLINTMSLESGDKISEIALIENLYSLEACLVDGKISALSEERKKVRQKHSEYIEKYVDSCLVSYFARFIAMTEEIDGKISLNTPEAQIQTNVFTNRNEYKKLGKDFAFKIVKKNIEKIYKSIKKQCIDKVLFGSTWHLVAEQIIRKLEKIHGYLKVYFVRVPEVQVDFEIEDLKQFIGTYDLEMTQ